MASHITTIHDRASCKCTPISLMDCEKKLDRLTAKEKRKEKSVKGKRAKE
jgi:hypothetical protein